MGLGNSLLDEFFGAILGLKLSVSLGVNYHWLESDCSNLVNLLTLDNVNALHHLAPIVNCCRSYLNDFNNFKVSQVPREGNRSADMLASHALTSKCSFTSFQCCPPFALQIILVFVPLGGID